MARWCCIPRSTWFDQVSTNVRPTRRERLCRSNQNRATGITVAGSEGAGRGKPKPIDRPAPLVLHGSRQIDPDRPKQQIAPAVL